MHETIVTQNVPLAAWTQAAQPSTIQQLLVVATQPDILSFALGLPAAELFPSDAYAKATARVLATQSSHALQYGMPCDLLKHSIVHMINWSNMTIFCFYLFYPSFYRSRNRLEHYGWFRDQPVHRYQGNLVECFGGDLLTHSTTQFPCLLSEQG